MSRFNYIKTSSDGYNYTQFRHVPPYFGRIHDTLYFHQNMINHKHSFSWIILLFEFKYEKALYSKWKSQKIDKSYIFDGSSVLLKWFTFLTGVESSLFLFPDGVNVATEEDDIDELLSLTSICRGEDIDMVEALLGLVILVEEFWRGDVKEEMVPLDDAPEEVMEADIIDDPVMDELRFVDVE